MRRFLQIVGDAGVSPQAAQPGGLLSEYLVAETYASILVESRADFLLKTFGEKLEAKWLASGRQEPMNVQQDVNAEPGDTPAQKLLSYLFSFDPTRNHAYSQWLCLRYLKDQIKLEDGPAIFDVLGLFHQFKARLPNKDINAYPSRDALAAAIKPFETDSSKVDSQDQNQRLRNRMSQEDQATIAYDGPDCTIVIPHTQAAATFWGQGTAWCTTWGPPRTNQFDYYNRMGPLYIIIEKPEGEKFQLSYDYPKGQFTDKRDVTIDMPALVRKHPAIIKVVGENKLLPWAEKIGIDLFSPKMAFMVKCQTEANRVAKSAFHRDEIRNLPREIVTNLGFQMALFKASPKDVGFLNEEDYRPNLPELLKNCNELFLYLPEHLKTTQTAEMAFTVVRYFNELPHQIAEHYWTPLIRQYYWKLRVAQDARLQLGNVPTEYRTTEAIPMLLARHPDDIAAFESILTPRLARDIVVKDARQQAAWKLPQKFFDAHMAKTLRDTKQLRLFVRIPLEYWDDQVADACANVDVPFGQAVPPAYRTPARIAAFAKAYPERLREIPKDLLPEKVISDYSVEQFATAIKDVPEGFIPDRAIAGKISQTHNEDVLLQLCNALPQWAKTNEVLGAFIQKNALPVRDIPPHLLTMEGIAGRVRNHPEEMEDVPESERTPELAEKLVAKSVSFLSHFPDTALTKPALEAFFTFLQMELQRRQRIARNNLISGPEPMADNLKQFAVGQLSRFPISMWDAHRVEMALNLDVCPFNVAKLPVDILTPSVLAKLAGVAPEKIAELPRDKRILANLAGAAAKNHRVILHLRKDQFTTVLCQRALTAWAKPSEYYDQSRKKALSLLPQKLWNQACWNEAVAYVVPLAKVPEQFVNDELLREAVLRDPNNITAIPDPVTWLTKHIKTKDMKAVWTRQMEKLGYVRTGGAWKSTKDDFETTPLEGHPGYSVTVVPKGENINIHLFHNGEQVLNLYTKDGKVRLEQAYQHRKFKPELSAIAAQYLQDYDLGDLDDIGIYRMDGKIGGEELAKRETVGAVEWSVQTKRNGHVYIGYVDGHKIMTLDTVKKDRRRQISTHESRVYDPLRALPHAKDIMAFAHKHGIEYTWDFHNVGIDAKSKGGWGGKYEWDLVAVRKVGSVGGLEVWTNDSKIAIYGKMGWLASGRMLKKGGLASFHVKHDYQKMESKLEKALSTIADYVMRQKPVNTDIPMEITPDKDEEAA